MNRKTISKDTLSIIEKGYYKLNGESIIIEEQIKYSVANSILYQQQIETYELQKAKTFATKQLVENCSTLEACKILSAAKRRIFCLNFASAKNPGGGFLNGAQAQEESLARSSALYASLTANWEYYELNRAFDSYFYLDHMIYSPDVPVFKDDSGKNIDRYLVSFLTAPAVNTGVVHRNEPDKVAKIKEVMRKRIHKVLRIAHYHNYEYLVLGAWGCGVFKNDPLLIAQLFQEAINNEFSACFDTIFWAVLDKRDTGVFKTFKEVLEV